MSGPPDSARRDRGAESVGWCCADAEDSTRCPFAPQKIGAHVVVEPDHSRRPVSEEAHEFRSRSVHWTRHQDLHRRRCGFTGRGVADEGPSLVRPTLAVLLSPEPSSALLKTPDRSEEIDLPKRRPIRVAEVELA